MTVFERAACMVVAVPHPDFEKSYFQFVDRPADLV